MFDSITPIPANYGTGFTSTTDLGDLPGYNHQVAGIYHNYHFTHDLQSWPVAPVKPNKVIDGFSPNLNKFLHAGHLKNLAVAAALANILGGKPVAMLGASLGEKPGALEQYHGWCALAGYKPTIYMDTELPMPAVDLIDGGTDVHLANSKEPQDVTGCKLFNGPKGPVMVVKSDGKKSYAAHDLAFAELVGPDYYLTGAEQKGHFESIGLGDKHQALGLLLGPDGKKMASSSGEAVSADNVFATVTKALKPTPQPWNLAWNIIACQMNLGSKSGNTKFCIEQWAKPEAAGMYITYTYAKVLKALSKSAPYDHAKGPSSDVDVQLCGWASYLAHYQNKAANDLEPHHVAQYALGLAKVMAKAYNTTAIVGGHPPFLASLTKALESLKKAMLLLGMYPLEEV